MVSPIISTEARKFCETTSVRGVPRIFKSKTRLLSLIWLLGVFTCGGCLIWQVLVVVNRYLSYPVNTLFVASPDWETPTFPDITICNACPLVNEKHFILNYFEYMAIIVNNLTYEDYILETNFTVISETVFSDIKSLYLSPKSYFRNFPVQIKEDFEPKNYFLIDSIYIKWDYTITNCIVQSNVIWNPDYYECYTLTLAGDCTRQTVRGLSAIIYVQDFPYSTISAYDLSQTSSRATGVRVMVHAPGTKPDMKQGMTVSPGTETTITIEQTLKSRLPYPYSNCTTQSRLGTSAYSKSYCVDVCIQDQFIRNCRCIVDLYQYTDQQLLDVNSTMCGNLSVTTANSSISWSGFDTYVCVEQFEEDKEVCNLKCDDPCVEYGYKSTVSSADWPHISCLASVYDTYYKERFTGEEFERYVTLIDLLVDGHHDEAARLLQELDKEGLIKRRLLQLNVNFESSSFNEIIEVKAFSQDAMAAQIGGVLSLWLGVTVMLVFEVCEFVCILVYKYCEKYCEKSSENQINSKTQSSQEDENKPPDVVNGYNLFDVAGAFKNPQANE